MSGGAIYVVRHGETVWNTVGRRQGRRDSPLTERGVAQAVAARATTVAVTHEMLSRRLLGAYAGKSPAETLALVHPNDRIFRLSGGAIEAICAAPEPA